MPLFRSTSGAAPALAPGGQAPPGPEPASAPDRASAPPTCFATHGATVYRYLRFQLDSPDLAEELTAETFFRAVRGASRFDPNRAAAGTWLLAIARNVLRDHRRHLRRRPHVPLAGMRDLACDAPSPEERLLWEEEVARLLAAVAELPARDREILSLRYGGGLDTAEVGAVLGLGEGAVRTRLWRALRRLRERLDP